jgi:uncharacterized protein YecE (DUF72 family)
MCQYCEQKQVGQLHRRKTVSDGISESRTHMSARVHIGTSGWNYQHWLGPFYPDKFAASKTLKTWAKRIESWHNQSMDAYVHFSICSWHAVETAMPLVNCGELQLGNRT